MRENEARDEAETKRRDGWMEEIRADCFPRDSNGPVSNRFRIIFGE